MGLLNRWLIRVGHSLRECPFLEVVHKVFGGHLNVCPTVVFQGFTSLAVGEPLAGMMSSVVFDGHFYIWIGHIQKRDFPIVQSNLPVDFRTW